MAKTIVTVDQGGTGAETLTDGGVLLGSGTGAVTSTAVLADGEMLVGDGTTDPVVESGATLRTSIGVGTGDSPQFTDLTVSGTSTTIGTVTSGIWQGTAVDGTYVDLEGTELKSTGETGGTKFLREDGDGTSSWQAATAAIAIGTSIGSGTSGSVLFVDSSTQLAQDNSNLFWDDSNNRLGIGKTPTKALDISDTSCTVQATSSTGTNRCAYRAINTGGTFSLGIESSVGGTQSQVGIAYAGVINHTGAYDLQLGTNNIIRMTIDATGMVGLGTAVPVTRLTLEGTVTLKEQAAADSDTAAYGQIWVKTGTPNTLWFTDDAGTDAQLGAGGGGGPGATELTSGASYTSTATDDHFYTVNNTSLGEMFVLTLPAASAASGASLTFAIKDSNANGFNVLCAGSDVIWDNYELINGYGSDVTDMTTQYDGYSLTLVSNGSDWYSNSYHDGFWAN